MVLAKLRAEAQEETKMTPDELKAVLEAHGKYLRGEDNGTKANLSEANLRWANLSGANLRWANLRGADLRGANLCGANLRGANLCEANLREANLSWANLCEVNLSGANLRGANLSWADLREANLSWADLREANLSWAGILRIHADYEVTLYPGDLEPVLAYGCERHALSHWEREVEAITREHEEGKGEEHVARRVAEIRAILALCRTVPQPVRAEAKGAQP